MKKSLLSILTMLFGVSAPMVAQSSSDDYIPLVKEGVTWECNYLINPWHSTPNNIPYTIEIKGDTIIDEVAYKCCVYTFDEGVFWNGAIHPADTLTLAFIREDVENKRVYSRLALPQEHVLYSQSIQSTAWVGYDSEILLYDFANINNPEQVWIKYSYQQISSIEKDEILINGIARDCYYLGKENGCIIEGIGYDGYGVFQNAGDLMCIFPSFVTGTDELPVFKAYKDVDDKTIYNTGDALMVFNSVESVDINTDATEVARYDIYGRQLSQPTTGINIIKMSDGTTKKTIVK